MSYDLSVLKQFSVGGKSYSHQETISAAALEGVEALIPIAQAGVLTVRTDANTGSLTMTSVSHGIATGNKIDVYWVGGQRRGMTAGTVAGAVVPIDLGAGTDLPVATTAIEAAVVQTFTVSITGSNIAALIAGADYTRAQIVLMSTGDTVEELAINLPLNTCYDWLSTGGAANPITGDVIDKLHITINDLVTARNVRLAAPLSA